MLVMIRAVGIQPLSPLNEACSQAPLAALTNRILMLENGKRLFARSFNPGNAISKNA
jgi:hypothetical protein